MKKFLVLASFAAMAAVSSVNAQQLTGSSIKIIGTTPMDIKGTITTNPGAMNFNNGGYVYNFDGRARFAGEVWASQAVTFQDNSRFTVTSATVPNLRAGYTTVSVPQYGIIAPATTGSADLWLSGNSGIRMFTNGNANPVLSIGANGYVGIGLPAGKVADEMLTVYGTVHARRVKVNLAGPLADYVFDKNYKLMDLKDVESYVNEHSHLPEVPSASEVANNGMDLGEMQNKMLQKIEELTLYVIKQQKEIDELKKK